jgi:hypothetical protein
MQAPNFILASPTAALAAAAVWAYCRKKPFHVATIGSLFPSNWARWLLQQQRVAPAPPSGFYVDGTFVFIAHLAAMTVFGVLFMHVQVRVHSANAAQQVLLCVTA